jgi:glycosyltransferase involved in cell wall biosynthesis
MKILLISQYFWPEPFRINDVILGLKERGHEIIVLTGKPNYPNGHFYQNYGFWKKNYELWNDIPIYRVPIIPRGNGSGVKLFFNYLSFAISSSIRALIISKDFDTVFVYEPSPITVGAPAVLLKLIWQKKYHFWVQDLWPASITAAAGVRNKYVLKVFNWVTKTIYSHAKSVLIQSMAFKPYIINQGVSADKIIYLPNSTETFIDVSYNGRLTEFSLPSGFNLMFAGNIGRAQSFDTLLAAAKITQKKGLKVNWIILGDGRIKSEVESKIKSYNLENSFFLLGRYPVSEMPAFYANADALLLSLKKDDIFSLTIPSKLQSYFAFGKPVIASIDGEGARIVLEAGAGFVSASEDAVALAIQVENAINSTKQDLDEMGLNAKRYFKMEFEREALLDRLENILID